MKNRSAVSGAVASIFFASVLLQAQVPQWAITHKHANYPPEEFILGVGYGAGEKPEETAKRLAQSDIATQIRVKVQTEVKNVQQTYELNQNQEAYADFRIKSTAIVDEQLTGAEIVETAVDPSTNTTYALAVLNKSKFTAALAAELTAGWDQAGHLHETAEGFIKVGKLNETLQDLVEARTIVTNLMPKEALHDAVAPTPFVGQPAIGPSAITSSIRGALSQVVIEKKGGDNQKGKIGEKFPEPFVVQVTVSGDKGRIAVPGIAVSFLNPSGESLGEAVTDSKGVAALTVQVRGSIGSKVKARLSIPLLGREFSTNLNSSSVVFSCALLDADVAFALKVEPGTPAVSDILRSIMSDAVTRVGYRVVDMSRFVLRVRIQNAQPTLIDAIGGALFSVASDVSIVLQDKESGNILGSITSKSKGVAKTKDDANEKSARELRINEQELMSLLEKARN